MACGTEQSGVVAIVAIVTRLIDCWNKYFDTCSNVAYQIHLLGTEVNTKRLQLELIVGTYTYTYTFGPSSVY